MGPGARRGRKRLRGRFDPVDELPGGECVSGCVRQHDDQVSRTRSSSRSNAAGTALTYSTYLGGSDDEEARDVAVDAAGNVYVTGTTGLTNFPVQSPFQGLKTPSGKDVFVAKLDPTGSAMIYGSYLGGSSPDGALGEQAFDIGNAIAVAADGRAYIAGSTRAGTAFPSQGPTFGPDGGLMDAFVARISPDGAGRQALQPHRRNGRLRGRIWNRARCRGPCGGDRIHLVGRLPDCGARLSDLCGRLFRRVRRPAGPRGRHPRILHVCRRYERRHGLGS